MAEIIKRDVITPDPEDWVLTRVQESGHDGPVTDSVAQYGVETARVSQPPLTDADVAKLATHRGQPVTAEQREGMDEARASGIHHSIV